MLSLLATISVFLPAKGWAALDQCAGGGIHRAGWGQAGSQQNNSVNLIGASAQIQVRTGLVCETDSDTYTNLVHSYSGISGFRFATGGFGWAEVGYRRFFNATAIYHYTEYSLDGSSFVRQTHGAATLGSYNTYASYYDVSCRCEILSVGGIVRAQTNFDPAVQWRDPTGCFCLWTVQALWNARTKYLQSDIPGLYPSTMAEFRNMYVEYIQGGTFPPEPARMLLTNPNGSRWLVTNYDPVPVNHFYTACLTSCT